jgi:HSP20 family protein
MSLLRRISPWTELDTLHRQMNRLFDEITNWEQIEPNLIKPAVELLDNDEKLTLRVLIPGIDKKDLDISVTPEEVTISGEYHHDQESKDKGYYVSEFSYGKFQRKIQLPVTIKNDQVTANYADGVLTLNLPKLEETDKKVFKVNLQAEKPAIEAEEKAQ